MENARLGWFSPLGETFRFGDCHSAGWPSGSRLPLFGTRRFGVAAGRVGSAASRFGVALGELAFGLTTSAFGMHRFGVALGELVLLPSVSEIATRRVGLRAHGFRFSACTASGLPSASWCFCLPFRRLPLGGLVLPPSASGSPLGGLAFGLTASAFRHAPLRAHRSVGWFCRLPLRRLPLGGLAFGLTTSAFRHAPLRDCHSAG